MRMTVTRQKIKLAQEKSVEWIGHLVFGPEKNLEKRNSALISRFHYITQNIHGYTHAQLAEQACKGGANWVQLRVKGQATSEWLGIAKETQQVCKKYGAKLIINDNVYITKEINADGVHLGKEDMSPKEARKILGKKFIIGGSTNSLEDVRYMTENGVDYIGAGPYRFTSTKERLNPVLGLDGIKNIVRQSSVSVIAIGGIRLEDIELLFDAGVHGVAVSSAINGTGDITKTTQEFKQTISAAISHATI